MSRFSPDVVRLFVCLAAVVVGADVRAAPEMRAINVRGLQIDGTTTIRIDGTGLLPNPELALSVPVANQTLKAGATTTRVEFEVTLDSSVEPGLYNLWLANDDGLSAPSVVAVDRLPDLPFATEVESLPAALHGTISGSTRLRTSFNAKAGETLLVEVESQRLGGKLRPVLHIFDSDNQQLVWTLPSPTLRGDARLRFTAPKDGTFTVELHDLQYAAPAPNFFRLKIGTWQYADQVFPAAVQIGSTTDLTLIGDDHESSGQSFAAVPSPPSPHVYAAWQGTNSSGFRPPLLLSPFPELTESPAGDEVQALPEIPAAVSGRLLEAGEVDRFQVPVTSGAKLRFEVFADRIGSPIDAVLELQNEKGGRLSLNDDAAGSPDSRIDYTVPANVSTVIVAVKDANGRSGPNCIYRVAVTPLSEAGSRPDFRLRLTQQRHTVATGNRLVLKVEAERSGYDGPIELQFDTPLKDVAISGGTIAAGEDATLMILEGANAGLSHVLTSLRGSGKVEGKPVQRTAEVNSHVLAKLQPWLTEEIGLAVTPESTTGFNADWGDIDDDVQLALGSKLDLPVSAVRPPGFDGPVRLTLQASQLPVRASNNQVDANRTLRSETNKPVELAADANAQKAWDAKLAADKVLTDVQAAQTKTEEDGKKTLITPETAAKAANDALNAAKQKAEQAAETLKSVGESDADALARAQALAKQTSDAVTVAEKAAADAAAKLKAAMDAAAKANADAAAKVADAETKQKAAEQAANDASTNAKNDGIFSIFVPAELKSDGYQFALRAELLSRDKKQVLDRTHTTVRRLATLNPIVVSVSEPDQLSSEIDPKAGATITVTGKVDRLAGMNQSVTVTLAGLPKGIAVPKVALKPEEAEFKLEVKFPANFKPAELTDVRLFATGKMRPNAPIDVRSKDVPLKLSLKAKTATATDKS